MAKIKQKFILGIDTVSEISSIAIGEKDLIWRGNRQQSKEILLKIEELCAESKINLSELKGVAAVVGPGSYTGIRIGVSVANTFGQVLNVPVREIDSLTAQVLGSFDELLVWPKKIKRNGKKNKNKVLFSLLTAGYARVYGRKFVIDSKGELIEGDFFHGEVSDFLSLKENTQIVGEFNNELRDWLVKNKGQIKKEYDLEVKNSRARVAVDYFDFLSQTKKNLALPKYYN